VDGTRTEGALRLEELLDTIYDALLNFLGRPSACSLLGWLNYELEASESVSCTYVHFYLANRVRTSTRVLRSRPTCGRLNDLVLIANGLEEDRFRSPLLERAVPAIALFIFRSVS
jgi:hypothetical protein